MRILITGAAGFVGSHLATELAAGDHEVLGIDKNEADLAVPYETEKAIIETRPDYVVHMGARYGRILCRMEPHRAVADNAAGTTELAAVCAELEIPVLYASSSEVYGDHGMHTITEASELRTPTTIYGLSKRWGEEALSLYLPPEQRCVVRMNMLYGPRQRSGLGCCALAQFIAKGLAGETFDVHAGTTRSWLYISDAVRALRMLIEGGHTGVFNLGNEDEPIATEKLADFVCDLIPQASYRVIGVPGDQIAHKNYSTAKLRATIGWAPQVPLAEGIAPTIEAERKELIRG